MTYFRSGGPDASRKIGAPDRKAYYDEAATWSADIHGALRASRRLAWIVAAAAAAIAVLEAVALAALSPLKTVVPYTLTVDRQTGYVQEVNGLKTGALTQDAAVTQAFLVQYVIARETFDATDLRDNYHKVALWSGGDARAQYLTLMQRTTPDSPLNLYSPTSMVSVTINSVSLLSPTTALVRFQTTRHEAESSTDSQQAWAAAIAFRYSGAPMSNGDRFLNPLGFQVTRYRRDADTVTPMAVPAAASFAPGPPTVAAAPTIGLNSASGRP
jgi:type IV secretion system protein VirB8